MLRPIITAAIIAISATATLAEPRVGDSWTYALRDDLTGELKFVKTLSVVRADRRELMVRQSIHGQTGSRTMYYTPGWARIDDSVWRFSPNDGLRIPQNIRVGQQWRTDHTGEDMRNGNRVSVVGDARVTARETVTTPAGTFDAFRIEIIDRRRLSGNYTPTEGQVILWYAPAVERWVRRSFEMQVGGRTREATTEELTETSLVQNSGGPRVSGSEPGGRGMFGSDVPLRRPIDPTLRAPDPQDRPMAPPPARGLQTRHDAWRSDIQLIDVRR
jgi:hypothetical protein